MSEEKLPVGEVGEEVDTIIDETTEAMGIVATFLAFGAKLTEAYGAPAARIIQIVMLAIITARMFGWL